MEVALVLELHCLDGKVGWSGVFVACYTIVIRTVWPISLKCVSYNDLTAVPVAHHGSFNHWYRQCSHRVSRWQFTKICTLTRKDRESLTSLRVKLRADRPRRSRALP